MGFFTEICCQRNEDMVNYGEQQIHAGGGEVDTEVKWNMFVTSFIPLWVTIILSDAWDIGAYAIARLECFKAPGAGFRGEAERLLRANWIQIATIVVVCAMLSASIWRLSGFLKQKEKENCPKGKLLRVAANGRLPAEFLLAYVLPMVAFDFSEGKGVMLFAVYFQVLAYLCIRNNNIYTNIYLELRKYRMYECDIECRVGNDTYVYSGSLVISRRDLRTQAGGGIRYYDFDNYVYIDMEKEAEG